MSCDHDPVAWASEHSVSGSQNALDLVHEIAAYCARRGENIRPWTEEFERRQKSVTFGNHEGVTRSLGFILQRIHRGEVFLLYADAYDSSSENENENEINDGFDIEKVLNGQVKRPTRPVRPVASLYRFSMVLTPAFTNYSQRPLEDAPWIPQDVAHNMFEGRGTNARELLELLFFVHDKYLNAHREEKDRTAMSNWSDEMERRIKRLEQDDRGHPVEMSRDLQETELLVRHDLALIAERVRNHQRIESKLLTPAGLFPKDGTGDRDAYIPGLFNDPELENADDFFPVHTDRVPSDDLDDFFPPAPHYVRSPPSSPTSHNTPQQRFIRRRTGGDGGSVLSLGRINLRTAKRIGYTGRYDAQEGGYAFQSFAM
ncbi:hypothetical protein JCM10212_000198 [Sporobolomyces blumeae]